MQWIKDKQIIDRCSIAFFDYVNEWQGLKNRMKTISAVHVLQHHTLKKIMSLSDKNIDAAHTRTELEQTMTELGT